MSDPVVIAGLAVLATLGAVGVVGGAALFAALFTRERMARQAAEQRARRAGARRRRDGRARVAARDGQERIGAVTAPEKTKFNIKDWFFGAFQRPAAKSAGRKLRNWFKLPKAEYSNAGGMTRRISPKTFRRGRGKVWQDGVKRWKYQEARHVR